MLKKEQMIKGAILEVLPVIKNGVEKDGIKDHLYLNENGDGFLTTGRHWGVRSGAILEVVEKPKRRAGGANTAIIKTQHPSGETIQGHVFWCELRVSAKLLKTAEEAAAEKAAT